MTKFHFNINLRPKIVMSVITALCVLSLGLQYFHRADAVSVFTVIGSFVVPFQEGVNQAGGAIYESEQKKLTMDGLNDKITELESQITELSLSNEQLRYSAEENSELKRLLNMKERYSEYEMMGATVIGSDGVNWFHRFTINVGSDDGIKVDMNVINEDGLIGIVSSVGKNYSVVTSIVENGMNVSATLRNTKYNCIVTGNKNIQNQGLLTLSNASNEFDTTNDSTLITSQVSDKYLPNLVIGYVQEIGENSDALTKSGTVRTAVDFTRLRDVLVITTMKEELQEGVGEQ